MYGDTRVIRKLAARMRDQAADLRREADALVGRAESVPWHGFAADSMRVLARDHGARLRTSAHAHEEAADALDRHATEVDRLTSLIAEIEHRAHRLIAAARDRLADLGRRVLGGLADLLPDPVDQFLDRFIPPPHGHKDWLTVELPGLGR